MNNISTLSDYEPNNGSTTERDILSSVLHVADKFCLPISESDAGDRLGSGCVGSERRTAPPTLKNIRRLDDINGLVALATSEAKRPMTDNVRFTIVSNFSHANLTVYTFIYRLSSTNSSKTFFTTCSVTT